jgi:solute carrier family 25 S-adenosylmethionine transporter 26
MLGSSPSAAIFFVAYESSKIHLKPLKNHETIHMIAASIGEVAACLVRVPTEVLKQRLQVGMFKSLNEARLDVISKEGYRGLYRGFSMTIFREIPFASIQFPLYERLKVYIAQLKGIEHATVFDAGICGMVAGGTAAAVTTPLDVMKTRIMVSTKVILTNLRVGPKKQS